jgi:putative transposase
VIAFIREHKDHSVPGPDGEAGLRFGVEPMCEVLTEHGIKIAPATYYEWVDRQPARRELRDVEVTELIRAEREHPRTGRFASGLGSRKMWIRYAAKAMTSPGARSNG